MRELQFETGGRKFFNEDVVDLQDHLISIQNMFVGEQPFILSGMVFTNVGGSIYDITEGYIWLDGKIRFFDSQTGIDIQTNSYINVLDTSEYTEYEDLSTKVSSIVYGSVIGSIPLGNESIAISTPSDISRYYENILGDKYLQIDAENLVTVLSQVQFDGSVTFSERLTAQEISASDVSVHSQVSSSNDISIAGSINSDLLQVDGTITAGEIYTLGSTVNLVVRDDGKLNTDTVRTGSIEDLAVTEPKIANGAVTNLKIATAAVDANKLAPNSVTEDKIFDGAVTADKIQDLSIDSSKIRDNAVTSAAIADNSVNSDHLVDSLAIVVGSGTIENAVIDTLGTPITVTHNLNLQSLDDHFLLTSAIGAASPVSCSATEPFLANEFTLYPYTPFYTLQCNIEWQIIKRS